MVTTQSYQLANIHHYPQLQFDGETMGQYNQRPQKHDSIFYKHFCKKRISNDSDNKEVPGAEFRVHILDRMNRDLEYETQHPYSHVIYPVDE